MSNAEILNRSSRIEAMGFSLGVLYARAKSEFEINGRKEGYRVELENLITKNQLPPKLAGLLSIVGIPEDEIMHVRFSHYNAHEDLEPFYSFSLSWGRERSRARVINQVYFNFKEKPEEKVIDDFFTRDSKYDINGIDPQQNEVPLEDRETTIKQQAMGEVMADEGFQFAIAEELVGMFTPQHTF